MRNLPNISESRSSQITLFSYALLFAKRHRCFHFSEFEVKIDRAENKQAYSNTIEVLHIFCLEVCAYRIRSGEISNLKVKSSRWTSTREIQFVKWTWSICCGNSWYIWENEKQFNFCLSTRFVQQDKQNKIYKVTKRKTQGKRYNIWEIGNKYILIGLVIITTEAK